MKIEIAGAFSTYSKAQEVVRELELAGITREEVGVLTDAEHDARGTGTNSPESHSDRSPKKDASPKFADDADGLTKQPYPGRTVAIVRSSDARAVDRIADLLRQHGAENVSRSGEPTVKMQQNKPEITPAPAVGATASGLGSPGITTGEDDSDLEARGKEFHTPRKYYVGT